MTGRFAIVADPRSAPTWTALDKGVRMYVRGLWEHGVDTFESCEGGEGHAYAEPTVRFHGNHSEGFRALAICLSLGYPVDELRRFYDIYDGEAHGPYWALTFHPTIR